MRINVVFLNEVINGLFDPILDEVLHLPPACLVLYLGPVLTEVLITGGDHPVNRVGSLSSLSSGINAENHRWFIIENQTVNCPGNQPQLGCNLDNHLINYASETLVFLDC